MTAENEGPERYRQYEVLVCTGDLSFTGTLRCDFSQRLIDALNEGTRTETRAISGRFSARLECHHDGHTGR